MGIPGLWDILGDGEVASIAQLASDHFRNTGRPLRIAVDEAGWRFHNLTPFQVKLIREKEPAANPVEKAIFFRLIKLLRLNLQPIFIFDGPGRPWKRNKKGGGRLDYKETALLIKLLDLLKVPHHRAPAEAEAECARLQMEGIVDAVWSEDGDTLMFGCNVLWREYREDNKKSETHIRLYRAEKILQSFGLDQAALVLFAVLSGGDYDTKGLPGCGPQLAFKAAQSGLGPSLCRVQHERELHGWRQELAHFLSLHGSRISIPPNFPRFLHVNHYARPKVSTIAQLHDLRGLRRGWNMDIDQNKLREFVRARFNIWTRGFIKHIVPVLLAQKLSRTVPDQQHRNARFEITFAKPPKKRKTDNVGTDQEHNLECKVSYSPLTVVDIDLSTPPLGEFDEDWTVFAAKDGTPYNPAEKVMTEIPECLLVHGLPSTTFDVAAPLEVEVPKTSRVKRKKSAVMEVENNVHIPQRKRLRKSAMDDKPNLALYTAPAGLSNSRIPAYTALTSPTYDKVEQALTRLSPSDGVSRPTFISPLIRYPSLDALSNGSQSSNAFSSDAQPDVKIASVVTVLDLTMDSDDEGPPYCGATTTSAYDTFMLKGILQSPPQDLQLLTAAQGLLPPFGAKISDFSDVVADGRHLGFHATETVQRAQLEYFEKQFRGPKGPEIIDLT